MSKQNDIEHLVDMMQQGKMTAAEANVQMVRNERVKVVVNRLPREVRTALNNAVKSGVLGHMKKDKFRPEVYYHPTFEYMAHDARRRAHEESIRILNKVAGND
jgi:hypothetical protein